MDIKDYPLRADAEYLAEQAYLRGRVQQIEKSLGKVAAKLAPGELSQPMDALDRARELSNQLEKQVRVQSLESAIASHKAWLDRARANQARAASSGEPVLDLNRIELDHRILDEILTGWHAKRN
ncbi:MAG: hypothetical protein KDH92_08565 [Chloroflexi bacterium]|nr:hypothetical protein [Chloroflexota bacterium]